MCKAGDDYKERGRREGRQEEQKNSVMEISTKILLKKSGKEIEEKRLLKN